MNFRRTFIGLYYLLLGLCFVAIGFIVWQNAHTVYPTPETQSAFLKNYNPQRVIEKFHFILESSAKGIGSGAGQGFATHDASFQSYFEMPRENSDEFINALHDDMCGQLRTSGAEIVSQSGNAISGFRFAYKIGNSVGTSTVLPLALTPADQSRKTMIMPRGFVRVTAQIQLTEKWFPKGSS